MKYNWLRTQIEGEKIPFEKNEKGDLIGQVNNEKKEKKKRSKNVKE